ncbi:DNA methyltransferase [Chloroflexota bacterium]
MQPIPFVAARQIVIRHHYLHSLPGGTKLAFGIFVEDRLLGAITFGVGPYNVFSLVDGTYPDNCLTLTRFWLSEKLPPNSESRVISVCLRYLKKYTTLKFIMTYADPAQGHVGTIYQATDWLYTGLSEATPKFDIGDGIARHSRSLAHAFGSHSLKYLSEHGLKVKVLPQISKHRYIYFLDKNYRNRLKNPALPYPKKEPDGNR